MNRIVTNHSVVIPIPTIKPLHDRILVRRLERAVKSDHVWIPDIAQENSNRATVLAVGDTVKGVQVGDEVLVPGAGNKYPDWERLDFIMIQEADIGGIFIDEDNL